ncbi:MAG TPA: hypothetical protein VJ836_01275 [Candidatus Saccharimonadales bacterium]|nr:hypothetical protein [Candidatus Saccharimonadales bacterium]
MRMLSPFIDKILISKFFPSSNFARGTTAGWLEQAVLVIGASMGEVLLRNDGGFSEGGRLIQNVANRLGITACG